MQYLRSSLILCRKPTVLQTFPFLQSCAYSDCHSASGNNKSKNMRRISKKKFCSGQIQRLSQTNCLHGSLAKKWLESQYNSYSSGDSVRQIWFEYLLRTRKAEFKFCLAPVGKKFWRERDHRLLKVTSLGRWEFSDFKNHFFSSK